MSVAGAVVALVTGLLLAATVRLSSASPAELTATGCSTAPASPPSEFTNQTVSVNGIQLHYVRGGHGRDVVVLLHGWPENWYEWNAVMPAIAEKYTVLAVDLPGLGDSAGTPPSYDKKTLAGYVHGLVVDAVGQRPVHVVGHDFGAAVAFAYAASFRDSTASLTIIDFPIEGPATDDEQLRASLWWFGFHDVPQLPEQLVDGLQRTYLSWFYNNLVQPPNQLSPTAVAEYIRTYCKPSVLHGGFELYRTEGVDRADNSALTQDKLSLPILIMSPIRSSDQNAEEQQLISGIAPMADGPITVDLVPQSGHFVPEENPGFVTEHLSAFIDAN